MMLLKVLCAFSVVFLIAAIPNQSMIATPDSRPAGLGPDFLATFRYDWHRAGIASASSNIVTPHMRWTFTTPAVFATRPLSADVNGDGKMEIFFGEIKSNADPRNVYSLDYMGNILWTFQANWDVYATGVTDFEEDGVPEVILSEYAFTSRNGLNIYVVDALSGALRWKYTDVATFWEEGFFASPVIYDINDDGVKDLTVGSLDRYVYAFSGKDGSVLWKSPIFDHYILASSPLVDLDGDLEEDFVVIDNHAIARAYSVKTHVLLWEQTVGYGVEATPAIGDVDGDGRPEIVFSMIESGGIRALNNDGSVLWTSTSWSYFYTSPTLVDVDGDGLADVVNMDSIDHTVIAFKGTDGTELWHTPLPNTTWSQASMVTVDIDGDGDLEVLAGSDIGLYSLDVTTGQIEWLFASDRVRREPRVADIDGDALAEVIFGAGDGKVYVLDNAPEPKFEPRTIGYWKHQCEIQAPRGDHVGMQQAFIDSIRNRSRVFADLDTIDEACAILRANDKSDMTGMAKRQLLALWLNIASGLVDENAPINLPNLTSATTVGEAILEVENIILTYADKPSLERAKDICDSLNNGRR